jgi:hypothetical protein
MNIERKVDALKTQAGTTPGAIAVAAIVGIGAFILRRKLMRARPWAAAIEAATLASSAYGALRKAAPAAK